MPQRSEIPSWSTMRASTAVAGRVDERLEVSERREDQYAVPAGRLTEDREAGALDVQRRDVHPQYLRVGGDRPRRRREQAARGREQTFDRGGGHPAAGEVALVRVARRHRLDHVIEHVVELGQGSERDGNATVCLGAYLGGGEGIIDTDGVGPARRTDQGFRQRLAQHAPDGAVQILRHDQGPADDASLRQLEPDHYLGTVGFLAIEEVERGRENAADPLSAPGGRTAGARPARSVLPALHVAGPPVMEG